MRRGAFLVLAWLVCLPCAVPGDEPASRERAAAGLRRAVEYFRTQVATEGGYLWRYGEDLARREGEGKATATQVWVQPPGTPAVGLAYLAAYEATGDALLPRRRPRGGPRPGPRPAPLRRLGLPDRVRPEDAQATSPTGSMAAATAPATSPPSTTTPPSRPSGCWCGSMRP